MKRLTMLMLLLPVFFRSHAQQQQPVQMADGFTQSGKIYVVIATISIIFIGLAIYLLSIDRRLKKLEKDR